MARLKTTVVMMSLAGLVVAPMVHAAGAAVNTNTPYSTPVSIPNISNPLANVTGAMGTGLLANSLTGQSFGQVLMNSVMTQVTSQLLGKIDPSGMLGQIAGPAIGQALAGNFGGLTNTGLTSSLLGGGIQNAMSSGSLNFGGLVDSVMQGVAQGVGNAAGQMIAQQVLGGIQGGSGGGGGSDYVDTGGGISIGGAVDEDAPILSYSTTINTNSTNYGAGQYDGTQGLQPDSRFLMSDGNYDSNYWAGYQRALVAASLAAK